MFLALFGFAGGMGMPMQTSINAQLGRRVGSPFLSALLNFLVGIAARRCSIFSFER
ncbi:MAG: DMT family transporter [Firmicutes bacterium]|nr:DMT family transporter [Bacillota bacterium]